MFQLSGFRCRGCWAPRLFGSWTKRDDDGAYHAGLRCPGYLGEAQ